MKLFTRSLAAALALSFVAAPMAHAQYHGGQKKPSYQSSHKHQMQKHQPNKRHNWRKGQRVTDWKRRPAVRDWKRHKLHAPARNQQWVKVDNDYLLISLATGVILGMAAGR
ncbi:RcnB family protein [Shinella daejeonensis]|uniref:RcnB family protein n=1 Tax=Shinella daejeonensis TaxID=659017 RepID=UPI0020C81A8E|nr:RcnB family protein [Shinella daejeonensis]MCP8895161.1 RcnB family protein [Shinella daejeonensis]